MLLRLLVFTRAAAIVVLFAVTTSILASSCSVEDSHKGVLERLRNTPEFSVDGLAKIKTADGNYLCYIPIKAGQAEAFLKDMRKKTAGSNWCPVLLSNMRILEQAAAEIDSAKSTADVLNTAKSVDLDKWFAQREKEGHLKEMSNQSSFRRIAPITYLSVIGFDPSVVSREEFLEDMSRAPVALMGGSSTDSKTGITTVVPTQQIKVTPELSEQEKVKIVDDSIKEAQEQRKKDDDKDIVLCFVPVQQSWQIPAFFRNEYLRQRVPTEVQVAVLKSWRDQYGAELSAFSLNGFDIQLPKAPPVKDLKLLSKHLVLFCPNYPGGPRNNWPDFEKLLSGSTVWQLAWLE